MNFPASVRNVRRSWFMGLLRNFDLRVMRLVTFDAGRIRPVIGGHDLRDHGCGPALELGVTSQTEKARVERLGLARVVGGCVRRERAVAGLTPELLVTRALAFVTHSGV